MSIKIVFFGILIVAAVEAFFTVYLLLWNRSVVRQIRRGEIRRDEYKQPFLSPLFLIYRIPIMLLLMAVFGEKEEEKIGGWPIVFLSFAVYVISFLLGYKLFTSL